VSPGDGLAAHDAGAVLEALRLRPALLRHQGPDALAPAAGLPRIGARLERELVAANHAVPQDGWLRRTEWPRWSLDPGLKALEASRSARQAAPVSSRRPRPG
jgi:hypothetical protein